MDTSTLHPAPTLGGRLAQARRFAGLSQDEIADAVGASRKTVYSWERGRTWPPVDKMVKWAKATGFPAAWFLDGGDNDDPGGAVDIVGKHHSNLLSFPGIEPARPTFELAPTG
jgi:transcriptional regulator with XRE-family HTH domain